MDENEFLSSKSKTTTAVNIDRLTTAARNPHQTRILPKRARRIKLVVCTCGRSPNTSQTFVTDESRPVPGSSAWLAEALEHARYLKNAYVEGDLLISRASAELLDRGIVEAEQRLLAAARAT